MKTPEQKREIMLAVLNGARREYRMYHPSHDEAWVTLDGDDFTWQWGVFDYRLATEPKPKRRVPLTPDDLPDGVIWVDYKNGVGQWAITAVTQRFVFLDGAKWSWDELLESSMKFSTSRNGPWRPFWKEVE